MQICFIEPEVVVSEQTLQTWIDFDIVVVIYSVNVTGAIVDGTFELM